MSKPPASHPTSPWLEPHRCHESLLCTALSVLVTAQPFASSSKPSDPANRRVPHHGRSQQPGPRPSRSGQLATVPRPLRGGGGTGGGRESCPQDQGQGQGLAQRGGSGEEEAAAGQAGSEVAGGGGGKEGRRRKGRAAWRRPRGSGRRSGRP